MSSLIIINFINEVWHNNNILIIVIVFLLFLLFKISCVNFEMNAVIICTFCKLLVYTLCSVAQADVYLYFLQAAGIYTV